MWGVRLEEGLVKSRFCLQVCRNSNKLTFLLKDVNTQKHQAVEVQRSTEQSATQQWGETKIIFILNVVYRPKTLMAGGQEDAIRKSQEVLMLSNALHLWVVPFETQYITTPPPTPLPRPTLPSTHPLAHTHTNTEKKDFIGRKDIFAINSLF